MVVIDHDDILYNMENEDNILTKTVDRDTLHSELDIKNNIFNLVHLNIRSVKKNFDNLILLLDNFNLDFNDIIVLSESFQICSNENFNIKGYETFYNDAKYNKNDGVIVLVKPELEPIFSTVVLPTSQATVSRIVCHVKDMTLGITAVYKPPPISKDLFIQDLEDFLNTINKQQIEIFTGDVNINLLNTADTDVINYTAVMSQMGYLSYINAVTRPDTNTNIDHIFLKCKNIPNLELKPFVLDSCVTDHFPVMINIALKSNEKNNTQMRNNPGEHVFIKKTINLNNLKKLLTEQDWTVIKDIGDSDKAMKTFIDIFAKHVKDSEINNRVYKRHKKLKNWITNGIISSIKYRDKLKRKLIKNHNDELEKEYKTYRNRLNKIITTQKKTIIKMKLAKTKMT